MIQVEYIKSKKISPTTFSFWFKPKSLMRFTPGQFIELYLDHKNPDSRGIKRFFTISSTPDEPFFSITTKIQPESSTFKKALIQLQPGNIAKIAPPMGDFVLPKNSETPVVFLAGGIGCTPFASIIANQKTINREIKIYHSVNNQKELIFKDVFEKLNGNYYPLIESRIDIPQIIKNLKNTDNYHFYASGPEKMVEEFVAKLSSSGIKRSRIHTDFFHGY